MFSHFIPNNFVRRPSGARRGNILACVFFLFSFAVLVIAPSRSKRTVEWKDRFLNGPSVSCPPVHLSNKRGRTVPVVVSSRLVSGGAHSLFISPPSFSSCFVFILFCFVFSPGPHLAVRPLGYWPRYAAPRGVLETSCGNWHHDAGETARATRRLELVAALPSPAPAPPVAPSVRPSLSLICILLLLAVARTRAERVGQRGRNLAAGSKTGGGLLPSR